MKRIGWVAALLLLVSSSFALAGDEPEHRVLVYGLAIAAGCSEREARLIANSSWSMDMNHTTEAMHGAFREDVPAITNVVQALRKDPGLAARLMSDDKTLDRFIFDDKGALSRIGPAAFLHALNPKKGETTAAFKDYMQTQMDSLRQSGAGAEQLRQARLVLMGQYLHMYVDSFVHPDDPVFGHAKEGHPADYAYAHPEKFTQAALGTVKELRGFLKEDGRHDVDKRLETIGLGSEEKQKEFCAKLVDAVARGYSQDPDKQNVVQRYTGDVSPEEVRHAEKNVESTMNAFFKG
ncbi:MAG TPA: hypothetical protein VKU80_06570, partial [Planctomycetota bacterium]|nr:hypothetical protein [Planctomycetota bacterium]